METSFDIKDIKGVVQSISLENMVSVGKFQEFVSSLDMTKSQITNALSNDSYNFKKL